VKTKKNGRRNRHQRYKCLTCRHRWGGTAPKTKSWIQAAYEEYSKGKQTLKELARRYGRCRQTLGRYFDVLEPCTGEIIVPNHPVTVILDATFFSRHDGVLVARAESRNLLWKEIESEKAEYYSEVLDTLWAAGIHFAAFVIDGRRGVREKLMGQYPDVPIQFCQFHQMAIVTRYLSARPKLEAGRQLRRIVLTLSRTHRGTFTDALKQWHAGWKDFLKEKTMNPVSRRWHYTHRRIRSAYRSLMTNLPWLFTCQDHPGLNIPNTTNSCDGSFAHWKNKLKIHRGLSRERRRKMMNYLLENS